MRSRACARCRVSGAFGPSRVEARLRRAVLRQCRLIVRLGQRCRGAHLAEHGLRRRRQAPPTRYEPDVPGADCARCAPQSLAQYRCVQCMVEEPGMRKIVLEGSCTHRRQRCLQRVAPKAGQCPQERHVRMPCRTSSRGRQVVGSCLAGRVRRPWQWRLRGGNADQHAWPQGVCGRQRR